MRYKMFRANIQRVWKFWIFDASWKRNVEDSQLLTQFSQIWWQYTCIVKITRAMFSDIFIKKRSVRWSRKFLIHDRWLLRRMTFDMNACIVFHDITSPLPQRVSTRIPCNSITAGNILARNFWTRTYFVLQGIILMKVYLGMTASRDISERRAEC